MKSINVADFTNTIRKFINEYDLPCEVKRLAVNEVYTELAKVACDEIYSQALERESKNNDK